MTATKDLPRLNVSVDVLHIADTVVKIVTTVQIVNVKNAWKAYPNDFTN